MNYIFDFDGTLADSLEAFIAVFNKEVRGNKDPLTADEIQILRHMSSRKALRSLGIRWWHIPRLIAKGLPEFHALVPSFNSFKNLPETLRALQARGDKLFIVTSNTKSSVDLFLNLHNMSNCFIDMDTASGPFKKAKHIRGLMKKHGLKRRESVYIGDETRDIVAGRLAGVKTVAVTWGFSDASVLKKRRPTYLINEPSELIAFH